jgi:hypothetical protein
LDGELERTVTISLGFETGNGRNRRASAQLNIAEFAPIPIANEQTATSVKPGFFRSIRKAKRRFCNISAPGDGIRFEYLGSSNTEGVSHDPANVISEIHMLTSTGCVRFWDQDHSVLNTTSPKRGESSRPIYTSISVQFTYFTSTELRRWK